MNISQATHNRYLRFEVKKSLSNGNVQHAL